MLEEADRMTPASVRELYARTYGEMRAAGYTAVGEFHYLGLENALAAADAAAEAGIDFTCLHVAYARGGLERMRQPSVAVYLSEVEALRERGIAVGVAPHSVRACPRDWLEVDRPVRDEREPRPPRARRRAASRDRGVPRRARHATRRAARRGGLPR